MTNPILSELISKWAQCAQEAEDLGFSHTRKLVELRERSEALMAAITAHLAKPTISLEGLEIDG